MIKIITVPDPDHQLQCHISPFFVFLFKDACLCFVSQRVKHRVHTVAGDLEL